MKFKTKNLKKSFFQKCGHNFATSHSIKDSPSQKQFAYPYFCFDNGSQPLVPLKYRSTLFNLEDEDSAPFVPPGIISFDSV